jgi:ribosomal protein S18 acetylase RimI-like enzyme
MDVVRLRPTAQEDLEFVLALEHRPENRSFIGQWPREEHIATMARRDREHWIIEAPDGSRLGYLIAYDVIRAGYGMYVKRIAVTEPSRGVGRRALAAYLAHAFHDHHADVVTLAVRESNLRARRCYEALGLVIWPTTDAERADFNDKVDSFGSDCLVMRIDRPIS